MTALRESVAAARPPGRSPSTRAWWPSSSALDPATLTDDDFDGLLAASGLVGASADGSLELPTRMASVNAMLDVAVAGDAGGAADRVPRPAVAAGLGGDRERTAGAGRARPDGARLGVGAGAGGREDRGARPVPPRRAGRRARLPARRGPRDAGLRAAAARRTRADRRPGSLSDAGAPDRTVVRGGARRASGAAVAGQHLRRAEHRPRSRAGRRTATCRRGRTRA